MPYNVRQTIKVNLLTNPEYWVEIRKNLTYGELKDFNDYGGDAGPLTVGKRLELIITDWNLDDDSGVKLDVSPDNIGVLQEEDWLAVIEAFNARGETNDKKKDSVKASSPTLAAVK